MSQHGYIFHMLEEVLENLEYLTAQEIEDAINKLQEYLKADH